MKYLKITAIENGITATKSFPMPEFDGHSFDFGRKEANRLRDGTYLRKAIMHGSGYVQIWVSDAIKGKGSGTLFQGGEAKAEIIETK